MVQFIQRSPSFGEQLGKGVGGALSNFSTIATKLLLEKQKESAESESFKKQFGFNLTGKGRESFTKAYGKAFAEQPFKEALEQRNIQQEKQKEVDTLTSDIEDWSQTFGDLNDLLKYTGMPTPFSPAFFKNVPWSEAAEKNEAFDVAAFQLEKWAVDKHNKGTLTDTKFKALMNKLPNSKLPNARNRGRIKEWQKEIIGKKEKKLRGLTGEKKELTPEIVDSFLDQSKGDPKKAKKLAADAGYTW